MTRNTIAPLSARVVACLVGTLLCAWGAAGFAAADDIVIKALSNRADLISGGDALVEILLPPGDDPSVLAVEIDGRDVTASFALRSDGRFYGVVDGLAEGINRLTATLPDGRGAYLYITNHPIGGPVYSGKQVEPWTCNPGALDEQCNREPSYSFSYMSTGGGGLGSYDPDNPPDDVAMTTTDEGQTVPFIVRTETGTIVRDQYRIAVLYDPAQSWTATAPQPQWNRKLVITHGASCDITFSAGNAPSVTNAEALGRGFAVMSHALDNSGHNCDPVTQAEALIATKEYLVDQYGGPIRYTIGTGCSGGALAQQHIANSYPGVYQGITPACSFTDSWSSTMQYQDYVLSRRYYEDPTLWAPGVVWAPHQIAAVNGHPNMTNPITFTTVIAGSRDPSRNCPGLDQELVYHHDTNPLGIRCAVMDYMVNRVGRRETGAWTPNEVLRGEGHARSTYDNVGIQYGLRGLLDGTLTPSQFVDVNVKFGAKDIDYEQLGPRRAADPRSVELAMRTGAVNVGNNMSDVAIIDLRGPDPGAFHDVYRTYAMRERLMRHQGHVDNHILWRGPIVLLADTTFTDASIVAMDQWLAAIEADPRDVPLAQKVREDRPSSVDHRCTDGEGTDVPAAQCDVLVESYSTPRMEAGMPLSDDILKCALKPHNRADYVINLSGIEVPVPFTDAEWAALDAAFPDGVCDYTQQGQEWTETVPWLDYSNQIGGEPMGPAPVSVPFHGMPPPRIDDCVSGLCADGDPSEVTFVYRSGTCSDSSNSQGDKAQCTDVAGAPGTTAYALASNKDDAFYDNAKVWFEGSVDVGETLTLQAANADEDDFGSKVFVHLFDAEGETLLQTVEIHTSCSQPLIDGERFGALQLGDKATSYPANPDTPQCPAEGRVHGSGYWSSSFDKVKFHIEAKYKKGGLKGKLKVDDQEAGVKIDAKTITSLTSGAGSDCNGLVLDMTNSFDFTALGSYESPTGTRGGVKFRACGIDNGKGSDSPPDVLYVESITPSVDYNTSNRAVQKGNIHLHDQIR